MCAARSDDTTTNQEAFISVRRGLVVARVRLASARSWPSVSGSCVLSHPGKATATEPAAQLFVAGVGDKEGESLGVSPRAFAWSPDGTALAYSEFPEPAKKLAARHGIIDVRTKKVVALKLPKDHYLTDWSRDGKQFVTTRIWPRAGVFLMTRDGAKQKSLTEKRLPAGSYGLAAVSCLGRRPGCPGRTC